MSANLGQAVAPFLEELEVIALSVRQDTELPRFATGGLGTPTTVTPAYGNIDRSDAQADEDQLHIPFSEPIVDASAAPSVSILLTGENTGTSANESRWTVFVPASDTSNWSKPVGFGTPVIPVQLFDAHQNLWLATGATFQLDDSGAATAVVAARLRNLEACTTPGAPGCNGWVTTEDPQLAVGNSVLTRWSAGVSDSWSVSGDPTFIVDKGGWQVTAGGANDAFLTFGGVVVP